MKFVLDKQELLSIIELHVKSNFNEQKCVTIELLSRPKVGVMALIEVEDKVVTPPTIESEKKEEKHSLSDLPVEEVVEENSTKVVTTKPLFNTIN